MPKIELLFTHVDDTNFELAEAASREHAVILDFWASWCPPCTAMAPVLEKLAVVPGAPKVFAIDVDKAPKTTDRFKVGSMPTYLVFRNGRVVRRIVGADKVSVKKVFQQFSTKQE